MAGLFCSLKKIAIPGVVDLFVVTLPVYIPRSHHMTGIHPPHGGAGGDNVGSLYVGTEYHLPGGVGGGQLTCPHHSSHSGGRHRTVGHVPPRQELLGQNMGLGPIVNGGDDTLFTIHTSTHTFYTNGNNSFLG